MREELNPFQKALTDGSEEVRGVIVGGSHITGRLYYEDRPQGQPFYGRSDEEVIQSGRKLLEEIKRREGKHYAMVYLKAATAWEVRIWG